jgi:phosphopantothenate---cysteine ligase (CTP)
MMMRTRPRFLVTAGSTREAIDEVRDWGNIFTGKTGFDIARELAKVGDVELLTSNESHRPRVEERASPRLRAFGFRTHAQLRELVETRVMCNLYDAVFMSAAVADYAPVRVYEVIGRTSVPDTRCETWTVRDVQAGKVKSNHEAIAVLGRRTDKLIDLFRSTWGYRGLLVKFKLEVDVTTEALVQIARISRANSGADYLVANTLEMLHGDEAGCYLVSANGEEWIPRCNLAYRCRELVEQRCSPKSSLRAPRM